MNQRPVLRNNPRNNRPDNRPAPAAATTPDANSSKFHNPYNFIPALPRVTDDEALGDHHPKGHGAYHDDLWSGRIAVTLTTKTPLLIPDAAKVQVENNNHKTFPVRVDSQGRPYLAPTALKGMLRSAYEAVTNSRLGVFEKHSERLAYRMGAALGPVPARVELTAAGTLVLRLMRTNIRGDAGKLPRYEQSQNLPLDKGESQAALKYQVVDDLPQHGDHVWVQPRQQEYIEAIRRWAIAPPDPDQWQEGWVCVTGANIKEKKFERVFLSSPDDQLIPVTEDIIRLWSELVGNYQDIHKKDLEERQRDGDRPYHYLGQNPGKTAWSRHVYIKSEARLKEGTLCYVDLQGGNTVTGIQPVTIARRLFTQSPEQLIHRSLKPAMEMSELSPADRVFGWVKQKGKGAYKGNLRVNSVKCQTVDAIERFSNRGLPLAILAQPNPQQFRFYLADNQGQPISPTTRKEQGYSTGQTLRGRKVYPHHRHVRDTDWDNPLGDGEQHEYVGSDRTNQNRSINGWIKPTVSFTFNIDVTNLSTVELGGILWLLSLPENYYHRLGGGKPLGFGSVRLALNEANTDLRTGQQWQAYYGSLLPIEEPVCNAEEVVTAFKGAVTNAYADKSAQKPASKKALGRAGFASLVQLTGSDFDRVPFIKAFLAMAAGFEDQLPIHYPRKTVAPTPQGEGFGWFVDNESASGHKVPLPLLAEDEGMPFACKS
ncbi:MAG: TIGR03986 family CRISPR-associated RAMP protein [Phormidesmis priestleyi]|uniref:TIGR03986 family CRISPR-associated RAMP protein n=1 Tax=Phormidesmis priestleyi TaxID=268141 RepID=A0A2W4WNH7_9CYAN|nr:MAG: TIGR03986 family CRISPR-associated RAMP protein [Phormidesmis priestleyi]